MTCEHQRMQWTLEAQMQELQQLEAREWPRWLTSHEEGTIPLETLRTYADWCLNAILRELLPTLPEDLRVQAQACYDLREHLWSMPYLEAYYQAQQKASSECLPASNSL